MSSRRDRRGGNKGKGRKTMNSMCTACRSKTKVSKAFLLFCASKLSQIANRGLACARVAIYAPLWALLYSAATLHTSPRGDPVLEGHRSFRITQSVSRLVGCTLSKLSHRIKVFWPCESSRVCDLTKNGNSEPQPPKSCCSGSISLIFW